MRGLRHKRHALQKIFSESVLASSETSTSSGLQSFATSSTVRGCLEASFRGAAAARPGCTPSTNTRLYSALIGRRVANSTITSGGRAGATTSSSFSTQATSTLARLTSRETQRAEAVLFKRLFSSDGAPKRGWEKFYPKDSKKRPAQSKQPKGENFRKPYFDFCFT